MPTVDGAWEYRPAPCDIQAERAVLGAMLLDRACRDERLKAEHFHPELHQWTFSTIERLDRLGSPVDIVTVVKELDRHEGIVQSGHMSSMLFLLDAARIKYFSDQVAVVIGMWRRRRLITAGEWMIVQAHDLGACPLQTLEKAKRLEL